jgi:DNA-binding response OmpR family regulator
LGADKPFSFDPLRPGVVFALFIYYAENIMTETRFTKMEAGVLDLLQRNVGQIVTRTFFLENVWGYKSGVKSRTLDVHISKLRAKLAIDSNLRIRAVVGLGYRLERGQPIQSCPPAEDSSNGRRKFAGVASVLG